MTGKNNHFPKKIFIERNSINFPFTKKILENNSDVPTEVIENAQNLVEEIKSLRDPWGEGKKYILLTTQRGEFVKPCPCTPHYIGCNYFIINLDINCPMDCTYCILQQYLTNPVITVYVNKEDLWNQLDVFLSNRRNRFIRIGTGELGDSLAIDPITENSKDLISYFRKKLDILFELKTKSINIENVLETPPAENIIIAWSLNSEKIAQEEEIGAPSVDERINAAKRVISRGYRVAFHFDPIILYPGWEKGYLQVLKCVLESIDPARIAWISLGTLRFHPSLKPIIRERFPLTKIIYGEFISGKDGKLRYFKSIRLEIYKKIVDYIRSNKGKKIRIYFCMENKEIWEKILKRKPTGNEDIEKYLSSPLG